MSRHQEIRSLVHAEPRPGRSPQAAPAPARGGGSGGAATTSVLFVTELQVWPPHGGERIHAHNVIDSLSRGCAVTVLAPQPAADCPLLGRVAAWHDLPGVSTWFWRRLVDSRFVVVRRRAWARALERLLREVRPRVVWFNYGHWGHYADLARRHGARTVLQTHNAQSRLQRQGLSSRPLTRWHLYYGARTLLEAWHERRLFRRLDRVLSVSEPDRRYHARWVGEAASLYQPNYVNEEWYRLAQPAPREEGLVMMTGNFGAFQNQAGASWFVDEVWPTVRRAIPAARLELVGGASAWWRRAVERAPGVTCSGAVPAVTPHLRRATVGVVPLLHGSGTRFKVLEALACGVPLVSTTLGAEGIGLVPGESALLADGAQPFARAVIELLTHGEQRERLAAGGLELLGREYGFAVNTARLLRLVEEVL